MKLFTGREIHSVRDCRTLFTDKSALSKCSVKCMLSLGYFIIVKECFLKTWIQFIQIHVYQYLLNTEIKLNWRHIFFLDFSHNSYLGNLFEIERLYNYQKTAFWMTFFLHCDMETWPLKLPPCFKKEEDFKFTFPDSLILSSKMAKLWDSNVRTNFTNFFFPFIATIKNRNEMWRHKERGTCFAMHFSVFRHHHPSTNTFPKMRWRKTKKKQFL